MACHRPLFQHPKEAGAAVGAGVGIPAAASRHPVKITKDPSLPDGRPADVHVTQALCDTATRTLTTIAGRTQAQPVITGVPQWPHAVWRGWAGWCAGLCGFPAHGVSGLGGAGARTVACLDNSL